MKKVDIYKKYVFDEMSKNKKYSIPDLQDLVQSLNNGQAKQLCKYFSYHRRNNVFEFIVNGPNHWKIDRIDISNIYVGEVNPIINTFLKKNNWSLKKICKDNDIIIHEEFKSQGIINENMSNFIAKRVKNEYRIVDGIHRCIRLACDGKRKFKLIYY